MTSAGKPQIREASYISSLPRPFTERQGDHTSLSRKSAYPTIRSNIEASGNPLLTSATKYETRQPHFAPPSLCLAASSRRCEVLARYALLQRKASIPLLDSNDLLKVKWRFKRWDLAPTRFHERMAHHHGCGFRGAHNAVAIGKCLAAPCLR